MEKAIAQLRMAVLLLAGAAVVQNSQHLLDPKVILGFAAALAYAAAVFLTKPSMRVSIFWWSVISGFIDWGFITALIVFTGGIHSKFYLLYFLSILSIAMRYGLREVLIAGVGTVLAYFAVVFAMSPALPSVLQDAALRMGHVMLFAFGSGILARETNRHFRARIREEAQRLAVQDVTATVSHDLSNPLCAIGGLVEMLLDSSPETMSLDQRSLLHRINANAQHMNNLVANLLDAELIERGRQPFHPAQTDVNALVRRVVEAQAHQAEAKHIGLVLDLNHHLPPAVLDGHMIERLVANLLNNAVKFTPENGAVRVSTGQRGARLTLEVWDNGPDVPASLRSVLFDKFARQNDGPGIGLGLYICKSIVDMHQGKISVRKAGDGVAFIVEIPVVAPARLEAQNRDQARVRAAKPYAWRSRMRLHTAESGG